MTENRDRVLIIDDDPAGSEALTEALASLAIERDVADKGEAALRLLAEREYALVVTDLMMPGIDGMEILRRAREMWPDIEVIMATGYGSIERAVQAMSEGAFSFLTKPVNLHQLRVVVRQALEKRALRRDNRRLRSELDQHYGMQTLLGQSAAMDRVRQVVRRTAATNAIVLLQGESGTGKEVVARVIHDISARREAPFIPVNCAAISPSLLESELFGHSKGAFTGAVRERKGFVELADRGTLFLDEVAEIPLELQGKLLRVLEDSSFFRVGGEEPVTVDIRLIAATNRDLAREVKQHRFREDLYYRLNVITVALPPLRQRVEDIPILASHFLRYYREQHGRPELKLGPDVLDAFKRCAWPGNVRELRNLIERMVVLAPGDTVTASDLPETFAAGPRSGPPRAWAGLTWSEIERQVIAAKLEEYGGKRRPAAKALGIPERTFYRKLKEYGLS